MPPKAKAKTKAARQVEVVYVAIALVPAIFLTQSSSIGTSKPVKKESTHVQHDR